MSCDIYENYLEIKQGDSTTYYASVISADVSDWSLWTGHWQAKKNVKDTNLVVDSSSDCYDSSMWAFSISTNDSSTVGDFTYQFFLTYGAQTRTVAQDTWSVIDSVQT